MDAFRKAISLILFISLVITTGIGLIHESNQPLKYSYEDEFAYQTSEELWHFLHTIPITNIESLEIEDVTNQLPDNLKDYSIVRISVKVPVYSTVEIPLSHSYPNGWSLFGSWLAMCLVIFGICFGLIWPHHD